MRQDKHLASGMAGAHGETKEEQRMRTPMSRAVAVAALLLAGCTTVSAEQAPDAGGVAAPLIFNLLEELLAERRAEPRPVLLASAAVSRPVHIPKAAPARPGPAVVANAARPRVDRARAAREKR